MDITKIVNDKKYIFDSKSKAVLSTDVRGLQAWRANNLKDSRISTLEHQVKELTDKLNKVINILNRKN